MAAPAMLLGTAAARRYPLAVETAARIAVGVVLLVSAAGKARLRGELPDLLGAYGVPRPLRLSAAIALIAIEAVLGTMLLLGVAPRAAAYGALTLGLVFVAAAAAARLRGVRRLRCGCFGAAERSTAFVLARALAFTALAGVAAAGTELGFGAPSRDTLVLLSLAVLSLAVAVLSLLVLALFRQVGVLSLRISPRAALELDSEGPTVGAPAPPLAGLERRGDEVVAFFAESCRLCRELAPGVHALAREGIAVRVVHEEREGGAFARWNVPGSPFVVHVVDGVVAAKGLVNTLEQLDGLVAVGRARRSHAAA